jgi:hypothetical protein
MAVRTPTQKLVDFQQNPFAHAPVTRGNLGQLEATQLLNQFFQPNPRQSPGDQQATLGDNQDTLSMALILSKLREQGIDREHPGVPTGAFSKFNALSRGVGGALGHATAGPPGQEFEALNEHFAPGRKQQVSDLVGDTLGTSFGVGDPTQKQQLGHNIAPRFVKAPQEQSGLSAFSAPPSQSSSPSISGGSQTSSGTGGFSSGRLNSGLLSGVAKGSIREAGNSGVDPQLKQRVKGFFSGRIPF